MTHVMRLQLEKKLYLIYSLNVVDWICTLALLLTGRFYEANPISRLFIASPSAGFGIKVALPLVIVMLIRRAIGVLDLPELHIADRYIAFVLTVYLSILADHLINFAVLAAGGAF